jgi:hypothetical protein
MEYIYLLNTDFPILQTSLNSMFIYSLFTWKSAVAMVIVIFALGYFFAYNQKSFSFNFCLLFTMSKHDRNIKWRFKCYKPYKIQRMERWWPYEKPMIKGIAIIVNIYQSRSFHLFCWTPRFHARHLEINWTQNIYERFRAELIKPTFLLHKYVFLQINDADYIGEEIHNSADGKIERSVGFIRCKPSAKKYFLAEFQAISNTFLFIS